MRVTLSPIAPSTTIQIDNSVDEDVLGSTTLMYYTIIYCLVIKQKTSYT